MKDNYTIVKENFDTNTGITTVEISTVLGNFIGTTTIDDTDAAYPSLYHATEIAIAKALKKFSKAAIRVIKAELRTLKGMVTETFGHGPIDTKSHAVKVLLSHRKAKEKELKLWQTRYDNINNNIISRIAMRDKLVKKYIEKENN